MTIQHLGKLWEQIRKKWLTFESKIDQLRQSLIISKRKEEPTSVRVQSFNQCYIWIKWYMNKNQQTWSVPRGIVTASHLSLKVSLPFCKNFSALTTCKSHCNNTIIVSSCSTQELQDKTKTISKPSSTNNLQIKNSLTEPRAFAQGYYHLLQKIYNFEEILSSQNSTKYWSTTRAKLHQP